MRTVGFGRSTGRGAGMAGRPGGLAPTRRFPSKAGVPFIPVSKHNKFRLIPELARAIRQNRIQIVHAHHGRDYWPTILAARLSGVFPKVVISRHLASSPGSWISRPTVAFPVQCSHSSIKICRTGPQRGRWRAQCFRSIARMAAVTHEGISFQNPLCVRRN